MSESHIQMKYKM